MAKIFIPTHWRDLTGGAAEVEVAGDSLRQIVAALDARFPGLEACICHDGRIDGSLAVSIDGAITARGLQAPVRPDSEIHFLPAIGGG
jgi:molybdopterin synthase sulfur carrier subunit